MAADGNVLAAIPGGEVRMEEIERLTVSNGSDTREITSWALSGLGLNPTYFLMDGEAFFGVISPSFAVLAEGFEGEDERLRALAAEYGASRFEAIQSRVAHEFNSEDIKMRGCGQARTASIHCSGARKLHPVVTSSGGTCAQSR